METDLIVAVRTLRKPLLVVVTETARKSFRADERAVLAHLRETRDTEAFIDRMMSVSELRSLADARPDVGGA